MSSLTRRSRYGVWRRCVKNVRCLYFYCKYYNKALMFPKILGSKQWRNFKHFIAMVPVSILDKEFQ